MFSSSIAACPVEKMMGHQHQTKNKFDTSSIKNITIQVNTKHSINTLL